MSDTKRARPLHCISHAHAMVVAMERAIEWSSTLEPVDEEDAKWEEEFRERCARFKDKNQAILIRSSE